MEVMEDLSGSNDHSMVIKGKRTKRRQRPSSPVGGRPVVATSSSSSGGGGGGGEDGEVLGYFYPLIPSSATSTSDISTTSTDQEDDDQDIANCLILLAQGESGRKQVHHHHQHQAVEIKMEKFSSRRLNEMVTSTTGGKLGFLVYECKTCNRSFPSFQALGGHRASHKKPKVTTMEEKKTAILTPPPQTTNYQHHHEEEAAVSVEVKEEQAQESTSKCLERSTSNHNSNNKAKNHECSICGAEFSSGQALGGHMRRHRNPPPMTSTTNATKVSMTVDQTSPSSAHDDDLDEASHVVKKPRNNIFPLDLNLPAPAEDDNLHRELKFQQHHLVLTAPALVDCHY